MSSFQQIPNISGPTYGGVIYGLSLKTNYSAEPSVLTLNIVSSSGSYSINDGSLNKPVSVKMGSFSFNGVVWSYNITKSADQSLLEVQIIDNSVVLDRHYVILWKRGLLGIKGSDITKNKKFDFSKEKTIIPILKSNGSWGYYLDWVEKSLGSHSISRKCKKASARKGGAIVVGTEQFRDSECEIPTTDYNFTELKSACPIALNMPDKNSKYRTTHSGTLREVLQNWCADFGYDFYWDYSQGGNSGLKFFEASVGISNIPSSNASNLISFSQGGSMDGTYKQFAISYSARPKQAPASLEGEYTDVVTSSVNPFPLNYYLNKTGARKSLDAEGGAYGDGRSQSEFVICGMLGLINDSLRDIYAFENSWWRIMGYKITDKSETIDIKKVINFLIKTGGYEEAIQSLQDLDSEDLPSFSASFVSHDPGILATWRDIEKSNMSNFGRHYKVPGTNRSYYFCNSNMLVQSEVNVEPQGSYLESQTDEFTGANLLERNGTFSHDPASIIEELGLSDLTREIRACSPIHIELVESGLMGYLIEAELIDKDLSKKVNTLVIYPKADFVKNILGLSVSHISGQNELESSVKDVAEYNQNAPKQCDAIEDAKNKPCLSAEDEARKYLMDKVKPPPPSNPQEPVSGLLQKTAEGINISFKGGKGKVRFLAPSKSQYQFVTRFSSSIQKLTNDEENSELINSEGTVGDAKDVARINVSIDNMTDAEFDSWGSKRSDLPLAVNSAVTSPTKKASFLFAGEPMGLPLSPGDGLSSMEISLGEDGFKTSVEFSSKPPKPPNPEVILRKVSSDIKRVGY